MAASGARELIRQPMSSPDELLQGHLDLWNHALGYLKSAALLCAMELRIPDAILRFGGAASLDDLMNATKLPPSNRPYLHRVMRALTASGIFSVDHLSSAEREDAVVGPAATPPVYELTPASRLLVTGGDSRSNFSLVPSISSLINQQMVSVMHGMHDWIKHDSAASMSLAMMSCGSEAWDILETNSTARAFFYDSMDADTRLIMHGVLSETPTVFQGLTSLVDIGGGRGTAAAAIVRAFPDIKCTVMDLPHIVAESSTHSITGLCFVAGDMFEYIPPADAILLKWILHDWDDDHCINILRQCKKAIAHKDGKGKVIIIDVVIGSWPNDKTCKEAQVLCDLHIMGAINGAAEREEHEWRRIFLEAGFADYKITPMKGIRSVIEVYP